MSHTPEHAVYRRTFTARTAADVSHEFTVWLDGAAAVTILNIGVHYSGTTVAFHVVYDKPAIPVATTVAVPAIDAIAVGIAEAINDLGSSFGVSEIFLEPPAIDDQA